MFQFIYLVHLIAYSFASSDFKVILIDKSTHKLHVARYEKTGMQILKTYHCTTGKAAGDKMVENDLKTPEGVYFFISRHTRPKLKKKLGVMAILLDYPNPIDKIAGKTGYDIMLHATDDPLRLERNLDSEGCAVISDKEILEIEKHLRLPLTPIIIYEVMKPEYLLEDSNPLVKSSFEKWILAWEGKDLDAYIGAYDSKFTTNGMDLGKYREYKGSLNRKYEKISVGARNIRFYHHPKYEVVHFQQNYESILKNLATGFKSSGTKTLYFIKDNAGNYKIASENFTNLKE